MSNETNDSTHNKCPKEGVYQSHFQLFDQAMQVQVCV